MENARPTVNGCVTIRNVERSMVVSVGLIMVNVKKVRNAGIINAWLVAIRFVRMWNVV